MKAIHQLQPGDTVNVVEQTGSQSRRHVDHGVVIERTKEHLIVRTTRGTQGFWIEAGPTGPAGRQSGSLSGRMIVSTTAFDEEDAEKELACVDEQVHEKHVQLKHELVHAQMDADKAPERQEREERRIGIIRPAGRAPKRVTAWLEADTSRTWEDAFDPTTGTWKTEEQLT